MSQSTFVSRRAEALVRGARRALGELVGEARTAAGLSRREVAERMGYRNLDKGTARVASWEQGRDMVRGDRIRVLAQALSLDEELLREVSQQERYGQHLDARAGAERRAANAIALQAHEECFAENLTFLLSRAAAILDFPPWSCARVLGAGCSIALFGGEHFSLGVLLRSWRAGDLTLPCPCCAGSLRVYWVSGSPLSGAHQALGACGSTGKIHPARIPRRVGLTRFVEPARRRQRAAAPPSLVTVEEILAALGAPVPEVRILGHTRSRLATWSPRSRRITDAAGNIVAQLEPTSHAASALWLRRVGPGRTGGSLVVGALQPFSVGAWQGDVLQLTDSQGRRWTAHPGTLAGPDGRVVAWMDSPVPAAVCAWLIDQPS
ncbi:MAG: helix-turn-helix transcriptional regulator [bacterium]